MEPIKDLVSVIIPIYNTPEVLLRKCIESIINQTYKTLEVFLVNDVSTNNALEVCKNYENENIHAFHQENQGVSVARNVGIGTFY
jgi:glycosyltransferase involved in cell wall biosynthesis